MQSLEIFSNQIIYSKLLLFICINSAYGIVFLVRKKGGKDDGQLYAMKILKKSAIVQKVKTAEHTKTERQVKSKANCGIIYILLRNYLNVTIKFFFDLTGA